MTPFIRKIASSLVLVLAAPFASATVLGFDDIASPDGYAAVPGHYGGLDWSGSTWAAFNAPQEPFAAHSGDWRVATEFGGDDAASSIRFMSPTVFDGAWFAGFEDVAVTFLMYAGGQLVATSAALGLSGTPTFLSSGFDGLVDTLVVTSPFQGGFVMDDFSFHAANTVPEPGSMLLVLAGIGMAIVHRRRSA
ncbi:MAG: hypothetical protein JWQ88_1303 [Rhodoferax sp.]|nr:hypothetical protein [Rhodoferax sp.]